MKRLLSFLANPMKRRLGFRSSGTSEDSLSTILKGSDNAIRRQLVLIVLRDLLRKSGIPAEWIECRMLVVASSSKGPGMFERLVVRHWDARLLDYTLAFQHALQRDIHVFDPNCRWLHGISWEMETDGSCPYTELPEKAYWVAKAKVHVPAKEDAPMPTLDLGPPSTRERHKKDDITDAELEALFAIRDRELEQQHLNDLQPVGYDKTQPVPLDGCFSRNTS